MEYCLIIFTQQVAINASREGVRYAVVYFEPGPDTTHQLESSTYTVVDKYMAGVNSFPLRPR